MNEEFEKFQKQLKDLETKKISRQKNQTLPKYKLLLRQRREYDEQIMVLKEQREIISNDKFNVSELKAKYEAEFIKQLKKIEDDKDKMSKRTYQRHKKNVTDRYNARIKALEGLNEELLQSDKEEMQTKFDAQIEEIRMKRKENEEKINDLKLENDKRNLKLDRAIYYINKTQLKGIDEEISKTKGEIEELNNSISQEKDTEKSIAQLKELSKKQALLEQYQGQKAEFIKRNEKFTKKTLEKIAELKPELKQELQQEVKKEEKLDIKFGNEMNKKEADIKKHKLDIGRELIRNLRKNDFMEAGGKIVEKNEKENKPNKIYVRLIIGPSFPYLKYSTLNEKNQDVYGYDYYSMGKRNYPFTSYKESFKYIKEIAENEGLDDETLKKVDPFLLHYLSITDVDLLDKVIDDLKNGRGLDRFAGIIHYDMRNADGLKRREKKLFKKRITEKAESNGLEVEGHEKMKSMLSRIMEKITHKNRTEIEMLESPREENEEDKVKKYKKQYNSKESRRAPTIPMTIADPMKFIKKDQEEKTIDE